VTIQRWNYDTSAADVEKLIQQTII